LEPTGHKEERKTKEDREEFSCGRGTERRRIWREVKWLAADRNR
jgi:hypothetical protein